MPLTDEQLKALGLDTDAPPIPTPASPPPSILGQATPPQYPRTIMGSKIPSGALIPQTHEQGKEEYQQFKPQITSPAGTTDYFRQRQEQLDYKAQHPWGDPVSAHPGVLGKIGHVAAKIGNIAGDIVAPGTMALIPGTELHNAIEEGQNERGIRQGIENEATQAGTAATQEATREAPKKLELEEEAIKGKEKEPKPEPIFDKNGTVIGFNTGTELVGLHNPKLTPDMKEIAGLAQPKEAAEKTPPHITKMLDGKPHIMERDEKTGEYSIDRGEAPPNYAMVAPGLTNTRMMGSTKELVGPDGITHVMGWNPETQDYDRDMGVSGTGQQGSRLFAAGISKQAGDMLIHDIQANKDRLGTLGTWVEKYGLNTPIADPVLARLQSELSSFAALQPAQHGFRSHNAMETFQAVIGGLQKNPDATIQAIRGITATTSLGLPGGGNTGKGPSVGTVEDGFRFKGGDASKKENWEPVK